MEATNDKAFHPYLIRYISGLGGFDVIGCLDPKLSQMV